jgi:twitching motility protein PilT
MAKIDDFLRAVVAKGGEELFLATDRPPASRTNKTLTPVSANKMTTADIDALILEIVPAKRASAASFKFGYSAPLGAFRGACQRGADGSVQLLMRKGGEDPVFDDAIAPPAAPAPVATAAPAPAPAAEPVLEAAPAEIELSAFEDSPAPQPAIPARPAAPVPPPPPAIPVMAPVHVPLPPVPPPVVPPLAAAARPLLKPGEAPPINRLFDKMFKLKSSDLHLSSMNKPMIRIDGSMVFMPGENMLTPDVLYKLILPIIPERNRLQYETDHDTDFAYEIPGLSRFRCNIFMDRFGPCAVFRTIPTKILSADDLKLPVAVRNFSNLSKGLVLVTGPTGSGKSTTLAAMIDLVNLTREDHIITIEDPIEFVHPNKKCLVNQREIHTHTLGFKNALRAALREDPDICMVGEMRDLETIEIAIETAETGHLVFGTLHTTTAASTINRIIEQFPADRQAQIRVMLSESLRGVVSQTLCKKIGGGRVAALEILIVTPAIANLIREGKTFQIPGTQQTSKGDGMTVLSEVLADFVKRGIVEAKEAYVKAADKKGYIQALENMKYNIGPLMAQLGGTIDL